MAELCNDACRPDRLRYHDGDQGPMDCPDRPLSARAPKRRLVLGPHHGAVGVARHSPNNVSRGRDLVVGRRQVRDPCDHQHRERIPQTTLLVFPQILQGGAGQEAQNCGEDQHARHVAQPIEEERNLLPKVISYHVVVLVARPLQQVLRVKRCPLRTELLDVRRVVRWEEAGDDAMLFEQGHIQELRNTTLDQTENVQVCDLVVKWSGDVLLHARVPWRGPPLPTHPHLLRIRCTHLHLMLPINVMALEADVHLGENFSIDAGGMLISALLHGYDAVNNHHECRRANILKPHQPPHVRLAPHAARVPICRNLLDLVLRRRDAVGCGGCEARLPVGLVLDVRRGVLRLRRD
mmetsp:Transcript_39059/g.112217  ORF Transcript_39059/g.112217 Transcript_39059/m.112217 type:complete len:350 (+) Transcript_39059:1122-2171(+)